MPGLFHITARDHNAFILMTCLAERFGGDDAYLSLDDIANDMRLSQGYLEEVAGSLKRAGLIVGKQGPRGGYCLARAPQEITLEDIITAMNGPVELVDCQKKGVGCPVSEKCASKNVWAYVQRTIHESLHATTLDAVLKNV